MSDSNKKRKKVRPKQNTVIEEEKELVFLYDDDEVNPNYNKEADMERKAKKAKVKKRVGIVCASVLGAILAIYLGIALFFHSHFYFNTTINGNDFSTKTIEDVEEYMAGQVDGYVLSLIGNDNTTETITGKEISMKYKKGEGLAKVLESQNPFLWPKSLWEKEDLHVEVGVEYDKKALDTKIASLKSVSNPKPTNSVSAMPVFDGNQFTIKKEVYGNKVDITTMTKAIEDHLNGFVDTLNMEEEQCYVQPKFLSDAKEVAAARDKMNQYIKASVTYDFTPHTEVVDKAVISGWLTVDGDMNVTFQKEKVTEYIKGLASKYNTSGKPRSFVTANGNTVEVRNGVYGWKINQDKEYKKLVANIEAGETVIREPEYSRRAKSHEGNDFGNTYVEIDLSSQRLWFIKDGQKMMESDIVTGNPNKGNATPQGVYTVTYKTKNATLRGPKQPDGSYEWESPVSFWMPFNGGIGMHDANWQSAFGGSRYKTHGSHGCVNMPYEKAKQVYGYIDAGTVVVCHY